MRVFNLEDMPVRSPGDALVYDFLTAVKEQGQEPGPASAEEKRRRQEFGRRWRGTMILARVAEDGDVSIHQSGLYETVDDGAGDTWEEPVYFKGAVGRIKTIGPKNGYLSLTGNKEIDLPHPAVNALELGLDVEILDLGRIER